MLQWGRAFSSAEIEYFDKDKNVGGDASMGPRFFKRGNRPSHLFRQSGAKLLQWGRAFSSAEMKQK